MTKAMFALCLAAAVAVPGRRAEAQSGDGPNLIFSISLGYLNGGPLWTVGKQPLPAGSGQFDTVRLERRLRPGFAAVLGATLYGGGGHMGVGVEVGLFALGSESRCAAVDSFRTDPTFLNQQTCASIQGEHVPTNLASFQAGLTYQFGRRGAAQPYVRAAGGFAMLGNSFIQTKGVVILVSPAACQSGCSILILDSANRKEFSWNGTLAVGASMPMGPGYRFRVEARDAIMSLPVATGPAPNLGAGTGPIAPSGTSVRHVLAFSFGLDVVLEHRRSRRY